MKTEDRHRTIAEILRRQSGASVEELVQACAASGATIRRDLEILAGHGVLRRVHGGARSLIGQGRNPGYGQRELEERDAKARIAAAVAGLLADREHVWLDSGSTATEVARALSGRELTLMPMSLQALNAAARVVVAASAAKWRATARVLVAGLDRVDTLVTDRQLGAQDKAELDKYSVEVVNV
jgi:DeoR/GlpR family transcriptional regulator of sugar metabolism